MLLNVYAQRESRTVHKRYSEALQARRLTAIENLNPKEPPDA